MTKKKRFGISEALTRGLSETIHVVENNAGVYRNIVLPLSRIELDPDNPRKLSIDLIDIKQGIRPDDPLYSRKQQELEKLKELAHTIKTSGVINPVVVYKRGELYRVVAGERRCLAAILTGKQEIDARVFNDKPKSFDLKLIQWIENTAREDLTLDERLGNIREIIHEYQQQQGGDVSVNATLLKNITGLSLSQTTYYLAAMNAPADVQVEIQKGNIRNLDKAALLASISSVEIRQQAIAACINGSSLKELRSFLSQQNTSKSNKPIWTSQRGRTATKINMGSTSEAKVIKALIEAILVRAPYAKHLDLFTQTDWKDIKQVTKAFRKLIEILEVEMVE